MGLRLLLAVIAAAALACVLLLLGFVWFTSYLIWWWWVAAVLSSLPIAVLYGGRQASRTLPAFVACFLASLAAQWLIIGFVLAPRLN